MRDRRRPIATCFGIEIQMRLEGKPLDVKALLAHEPSPVRVTADGWPN